MTMAADLGLLACLAVVTRPPSHITKPNLFNGYVRGVNPRESFAKIPEMRIYGNCPRNKG